MKFLADAMLGKLTRWLRMVGQDVEYFKTLSDSKLLEIAKQEKRCLLTKDLDLYRHAFSKGINAFYLESRTESETLSELSKKYRLKLVVNMSKSRCPLCNSKIKQQPKEMIVNQLKKNTFTYYDKFWRCLNCGQIYWQGTHWEKIRKTIKEANPKLKREEKNYCLR